MVYRPSTWLGLAHHEPEDVVVDLLELGRPLDVRVPGAGQVDVNDLDEMSGACGEDHDTVGEEHRLRHVVRDEDRRIARPRAVRLPDTGQLFLHHLAGLRVERRERLVQQEQIRIGGERAGQIDPLAHTAGQLAGVLVLLAREADQLHQLGDPGPAPLVQPLLGLEAELDVGHDIAPRKERGLLEDQRTVRSGPGYLFAVQLQPPGGHRGQSRQRRQERRLPAATRSDYRHEFVLGDIERQPVAREGERIGAARPVAELEVVYDQFLTRMVHGYLLDGKPITATRRKVSTLGFKQHLNSMSRG
jgi:hypothetical protein